MNIKLNLPEKFFEGEEKCGYYVSPKIKKVWAVQLDLLAQLAGICERHNIRWFMNGGTLLGAARHKGFIPWDHDVDVMIMRDDYKRFCDIAAKELQPPYSLLNAEHCNNKLIYFTYARIYNEDTTAVSPYIADAVREDSASNLVLGIFLDIFPVDRVPDDERELRKIIRRMKFYYFLRDKLYMWKENYYPSPRLWRQIIKVPAHWILKNIRLEHDSVLRKCINMAEECNNKYRGSCVSTLSTVNLLPDFARQAVWQLSDFSGETLMPFETLTLPAPSGWENILTAQYGDWHKFVIRKIDGVNEPDTYFYDTEHPYSYYTRDGHLAEFQKYFS